MKIKEIAQKYNIDEKDFYTFLSDNHFSYTVGLLNDFVDDGKVESYVAKYKEAKRVIEEKERIAEEKDALKRKCLAEMLISSGFSFEGYTITKYSGYISGDDATQMPRSGVFGGKNGENLTNALVKIRRQALKELKEAAYNLGCNAVVGVDFDYITLEPETVSITGRTLYEPYIICVTANGNAVVIEKNIEI